MKMYIGNAVCDASDGKTIPVINPATNEIIDTVPSATREDVDRAISLSVSGQEEWAAVPIYERVAILNRFVDLVMEENTRGRLALLLSKEMGKTLSSCQGDFIALKNHFLGFISAAQNNLTGKTLPFASQAGLEHDFDFTIREPIGTILAIVPFNAPLVLFAKKVAPALLTGNSVIIKPASDDPLVVLELTRLLREAGVPGCACQTLTGRGGDIGNWLTSDPRIAGVTFTGSTEVGQTVAANVARNMKYQSLELGGNAPLIICSDADIDYAVKESLPRATAASGQICSISKRFIVHRSLKDAFVKKLVAALSQLKVGDPLDPDTALGTLISEKAAKKVEDQVNLTISQGAKLLCGGRREGAYYWPTVLADVTPEMDIASDMEVFGPVFPILVFDDFEEALKIANNTKYGLASGVITNDMKLAMYAARKIQAGAVVINGQSLYRNLQTPYGGYKMSGCGREGQTATLLAMTQVKDIVFKNILI